MVDSYREWSHNVCQKLNFILPGALGLDNDHKPSAMG